MTRIFFEDYHHDGMDKVVEATEAEWETLVAPAVAGKHPIDASTVDTALFNKLYERPGLDLKLSDIQEIEHVVPLV